MNWLGLFAVAFGGAFAVVWLIHYVPLHTTWFGKDWSPRLAICKTLGPFDAGITLILVGGAWAGLGTVVTGIGMMVYNVMTGIGLSMGVIFVKKVLRPYWKKKYEAILEEKRGVTIIGERIVLEE